MMEKCKPKNIMPNLWFYKEVHEATAFYTSIFPQSKLISKTTLRDTPSGDADLIIFELYGQKFMAINGGPYFTINPSVSFFVHFNTRKDKDANEKIEKVWEKLSENGSVLMPLGAYPFSKKYGWIQDKYGVSWQIVPTELSKMMEQGTPEQIHRVNQAVLKMKKLILEDLQKAFRD